MKEYKTIYADPPWPYTGIGPRSSAKHRPNRENTKSILGASSTLRYGSMSIEDLKRLPIKEFTEDNSHLYLWTTNAFMDKAYEIMRSWGFQPKTIITWGKVKENGTPSMKTGYYYRGATEHLLFGVRGKLMLKNNKIARPTLFLHKRLLHSKKPELFRELIEEQSYGPYLELFAREKTKGWDSWGNEVENDIELSSLPH